MSFSSDVEKFAKKAGKTVPDTLRAIALELMSSGIKDTPVDTGTARGNWQTSIGSQAPGILPRKGAAAAISELKSALPNFGIDNTIYLTNNLPYIYGLEFDSRSGQAPGGMIRKNVARVQSIVAKAARDNKV